MQHDGESQRTELEILAGEAFSSQAIAQEWMNEPQSRLNGQSPLDVLASREPEAIKSLFDRLKRIKYGVIG